MQKSKSQPAPSNEEYREWLRKQAVDSDAAFAEYATGIVFPKHLREMERFMNQHDRALVLMPRGHAKTTQLIARAARMIGKSQGKIRIGIVTAVLSDAIARSRAIKTIVSSAAFAEVFPWAKRALSGTSGPMRSGQSKTPTSARMQLASPMDLPQLSLAPALISLSRTTLSA